MIALSIAVGFVFFFTRTPYNEISLFITMHGGTLRKFIYIIKNKYIENALFWTQKITARTSVEGICVRVNSWYGCTYVGDTSGD